MTCFVFQRFDEISSKADQFKLRENADTSKIKDKKIKKKSSFAEINLTVLGFLLYERHSYGKGTTWY